MIHDMRSAVTVPGLRHWNESKLPEEGQKIVGNIITAQDSAFAELVFSNGVFFFAGVPMISEKFLKGMDTEYLQISHWIPKRVME